MTRNAVVFSLLLGCTLAITALPTRGEIIGGGRYYGYVAVDRWGQKVFHSGTRHLFLSDEAYEKLKDKVGKPLQIDVTKMDRPMNPGSAMILKFSRAQVKSPLEGLELAIDCANKQPQRGNGITIRMTVRNTSKKTIEIYPVGLSMVLVTNKPTTNASMGYKDPDDLSYWCYSDVYIGLNGGNDIKRVACRKIGLKWTSQAMANGGKGITAFNRNGMDGVAIVPGGNYRGSVTIGKLLLPGEYQVFAYFECGAPGTISKRIDFNVVDRNKQARRKKQQAKVRIKLIRCILRQRMVTQVTKLRLASFKDHGKDMDLGDSPEKIIQRIKDSKDPTVRQTATLWLGLYGYRRDRKKVISALIALLKDKDGMVQFNAARGLAYNNWTDGVLLLRKIVAGKIVLTSSGFERNEAAWALLALGSELPKKKWVNQDPLLSDLVGLQAE